MHHRRFPNGGTFSALISLTGAAPIDMNTFISCPLPTDQLYLEYYEQNMRDLDTADLEGGCWNTYIPARASQGRL